MRVVSALLTVLLAMPGVAMASLAVFVDGRVLKVDDAFLDGTQIVLDLPGGGRMVVPAVRIDRVVADEVEDQNPPNTATYGDCPAGWTDQPLPRWVSFQTEILAAAKGADLHPLLLASLVQAESAFDPWAVSRVGASGLTQLMPSAAADHGVRDVFDPTENLIGGASHLRALVDRFEELPIALAAYNSGAATIDRYGGIPPYRETRTYVRRVLEAFCPEGE
jgi:hypothetical protein